MLHETVYILIKILLKFVGKGPINNDPVLFQIMTWYQTGDKPLSEPMIASFTDVYVHVSAPMRLENYWKLKTNKGGKLFYIFILFINIMEDFIHYIYVTYNLL